MKTITALAALLFSTALLLVGHGLQLTLLPLRASSLGMTDAQIGLTAAGYFAGFAAGCLTMPTIIARVGHVRAFAVSAALFLCALICLKLFSAWQVWLLLRFVTGMAISGLYAIIESWLTSQSSTENRGRVLGVYTFITLIAMLLGQFLINAGPVTSSLPMDIAMLFIAMAIVPVGLTRRITPTPVESTHFKFFKLYALSHSAFAGAILSGLVVGSFWSLGAAYAIQSGYSISGITLFMSAAMIGGIVSQYPLGWLSDRIDRRWVLLMLCLSVAGAAAATAALAGHRWQLLAVFLFGAAALPIYAISLATAADVSSGDSFVEIGTSILLLHALGAIAASVPLGQLMATVGPNALFWSISVTSVVCALYILAQMRVPRSVPVARQVPFSPAATNTAPAGFELDPRAGVSH